MTLDELEWERRDTGAMRAKLLLRGARLYVYDRRDMGGMLEVFVNTGLKSGPPVRCWYEVDLLTAQCAVNASIDTYGLRPSPWYARLWRYLRG